MNRSANFKKNCSARILFAAVALALFFQSLGHALAQDRWLLIFENSAAMKKRMPAVGQELQNLFFTSMSGQIHGGDSLGVWTFDQKLHVGEFPLSTWQPELAANTASNLVAFLNKRNFKGEVNFNALEPVLSEVVDGSHRLTVLIFCEGQGEIIWTPYNDGINQTLRQNYEERKRSNQPFVIVLRVQDGKYFGCSVNFPPGGLNLPPFPEPPQEIKPAVVAAPVVAAAVKSVPLDDTPLILVGKRAGANQPGAPAPNTNPPAASVPTTVTNLSLGTNLSASTESPTAVSNQNPAAAAMAATNSGAGGATAAVADKNPTPKPAADNGYRFLIFIGGLALMAAVALGLFLLIRSRQPRSSLITDSMNTPRPPPRQS